MRTRRRILEIGSARADALKLAARWGRNKTGRQPASTLAPCSIKAAQPTDLKPLSSGADA